VKFDARTEDAVFEALREDPEACITFPDRAYRADGNVMVSRDGLVVFLHRWLYRQLIGELTPTDYLIRTCDTRGCPNPYHRVVADRPATARRKDSCPNGHEYTPETELPPGDPNGRCRICFEARQARRGSTGRPHVSERRRAITHCPANHEYTAENTYVTPQGQRKCRTCTVKRARDTRRKAREARLAAQTASTLDSSPEGST
jgi:hypothetical protein